MKVKIHKGGEAIRTDKEWCGPCWLWTGSFFQSGYGRFSINQKVHRAHRVSYFLYNGNITNKFYICHKCDNPKCVNPKHLYQGTAKDNSKDMCEKGRSGRRSKTKSKATTSKYLGVFYRKDNMKWRTRFLIDGENQYVGQFDSEIEAAHAYDAAIRERGLDYPTNF